MPVGSNGYVRAVSVSNKLFVLAVTQETFTATHDYSHLLESHAAK